MKSTCVYYLENIFVKATRKTSLAKAIATLKRHFKLKDIDTIAVRGVSGMVMGAQLALKLNKNLCVVRKKDGSHSDNDVESGMAFQGNYIILDDLIDTGATIKAILKKIKENDAQAVRSNGWENKAVGHSTCLGIYLYRNNDVSSLEDFSQRYDY
jgi:adenine/guanine phosphoribosyltransferase-like PRPP-binding protein